VAGLEDSASSHPVVAAGRPFLTDLGGYEGLLGKASAGWVFQVIKLTEEYGAKEFLEDRAPGTHVVLAKRSENRILWFGGHSEPGLQAGDAVLSFGPSAQA
jgi:hypothetical protein